MYKGFSTSSHELAGDFANQNMFASLHSNIHAKPGKWRGTMSGQILLKPPEKTYKATSRSEKIGGKELKMGE